MSDPNQIHLRVRGACGQTVREGEGSGCRVLAILQKKLKPQQKQGGSGGPGVAESEWSFGQNFLLYYLLLS